MVAGSNPFHVFQTDIRNDVSRTLTTLLTAKVGNNPSTQQIEQVSRSLILKYPFMKDDLGSGYVSTLYKNSDMYIVYNICLQTSWVQRIQECLRNRIKVARRKLQRKGIEGEEGSMSKCPKNVITTVSYFEDILCNKGAVLLMIHIALMNIVKL